MRAGLTDRSIRLALTSQGLHRTHHGFYLPTSHTAAQTHLTVARQLIAASTRGTVGSHVTAALLHGLPTWGLPLDAIHVTRDSTASGKSSNRRTLHRAPLPADHITQREGIAVNTVERLLVDIARTADAESVFVTGDYALRHQRTTLAAIAAVVEDMRGWRGIGKARTVLDQLDARSESVGESRSRAVLLAMDLPALSIQHEIRDSLSRRLLARVDFALESLRIAGEFDGKVKYGRALNGDANLEDVLWREKQREDRIRGEGWLTVRWTWADLADPAVIYERFQRAIALARRFGG
ncbi:hypothetical protein IEU95_03305 [Hoyosella rhizosphaerae]|uniref:AbiEi antitoxin C-terminal domain-containing protein n=1 Tax=Hoyosella rhizosphaerae TaxID=1755582 RepID=A0A916UCJ0_9ACTN|nr:hypothetical protein [Hoyosella rhizosphaerae]MBN4925842.1 hypothetical protein [Hoyosella rhizosphaerae]GGC67532.1 hypothetical protein GCM10011410_20280 [Hoyosella rhizosphaerae]